MFFFFFFSDGPKFVKRPESVEAEANSPISLTCEVEGNPFPDISWIHEKYEKKVKIHKKLI